MSQAGQKMSWGGLSLMFVPLAAVSVYVLFLALVLHPTFQAHNVFLHAINYPFAGSLRAPWSIKGMPKRHENRVRYFRFTASDGTSLAGWHIASERRQHASASDRTVLEREQLDELLDRDLLDKPVLLYFHGNALNRGAPIRVRAYRAFLQHDVNVVAIDYRGFGDSDGTPTEAGLLEDARAAYKWIRERRKRASLHCKADDDGSGTLRPARDIHSDILLVGQSLGTGVASRLLLELVDVGKPPAGVLLIAPYTSIFGLLASYRIGGVLPVFWPLSLFPALTNLADQYLLTRFESDKALFLAARGGRAAYGKADDLNGVKESDVAGKPTARTGVADSLEQLHHVLPLSTLRGELGIAEDDVEASDGRRNLPQIVISHADDDRIIPPAHGHSLFETTRKAYLPDGHESNQGDESLILNDVHQGSKSEQSTPSTSDHVLRHQADWGELLVAANVKSHPSEEAGSQRPSTTSSQLFPQTQHAPLALFKNKKGGHNSVPVHAVDYFIETALGRKPPVLDVAADAR